MNMRCVLLISLFIYFTGYGQQTAQEKSLSIKEAVNIALHNNPDLKTARSKVDAAAGRLLSGISLPAPELSLEYNYIPSGKPLSSFNERVIGISQSFDFPSAYFLRKSKLSGESRAAETELAAAEFQTIIKVKSAYIKALAKQEELKLANGNLAIADDFNKQAEIRYSAGEATYLEQMTAKVQYTEAVNDLHNKENELKSLMAELNLAIGYGRNQDNLRCRLSDSLSCDSLNITLDKLMVTASSVNPLLKISELKLSTSLVEKTLAWTGLLPSFTLSFSKQSRDGMNGFYGASLGITLPIWFMFDQRGKIREAEAGSLIAESELQCAKNELYFKVNKAYNDYITALRQVRLYQSDILPQSDEISHTAFKSYEAGEIMYVEFLQAKQTSAGSRNNYINALLSYNLAVISLEEAAGISLK
jgi:outer membrane protein TolC